MESLLAIITGSTALPLVFALLWRPAAGKCRIACTLGWVSSGVGVKHFAPEFRGHSRACVRQREPQPQATPVFCGPSSVSYPRQSCSLSLGTLSARSRGAGSLSFTVARYYTRKGTHSGHQRPTTHMESGTSHPDVSKSWFLTPLSKERNESSLEKWQEHTR